MVLCSEDKALIKNLYLFKGYGPKRLLREFPTKNWKLGGLKEFLKKLRRAGTADRQQGSGRPKSSRIEQNISEVKELVLSQQDKPQTHLSTRQISMQTGISQSSVVRIVCSVFPGRILRVCSVSLMTLCDRN